MLYLQTTYDQGSITCSYTSWSFCELVFDDDVVSHVNFNCILCLSISKYCLNILTLAGAILLNVSQCALKLVHSKII